MTPAGDGGQDERRRDLRQREVDEEDLDDQRRAADERHVERGDRVDDGVRDRRPRAPTSARMVASTIDSDADEDRDPGAAEDVAAPTGPIQSVSMLSVAAKATTEADEDREPDRRRTSSRKPRRGAPLRGLDLARGSAARPRAPRCRQSSTGSLRGGRDDEREAPRVTSRQCRAATSGAYSVDGVVRSVEPLLAQRRQRAVLVHLPDDPSSSASELGVLRRRLVDRHRERLEEDRIADRRRTRRLRRSRLRAVVIERQPAGSPSRPDCDARRTRCRSRRS